MLRITDTDGARIGYVAIDLSDGETSATFQVRVLPADGYFLKASPSDADFEIQARTGMGAFADIAASPIDLSGFPADVPVTFDVRAVAADPLVDVRRLVVNLAVVKSTPAAWAA